jgi:EmrB/QacA subfamily drug resistance transporter
VGRSGILEGAGGPGTAAGRRRACLAVGIALSLAMGFIDSTAVNVALPSIQREFNIPSGSLEWTVTAFFLSAAVVISVAGGVADLLGRRRVLFGGVVGFTWASAMCGLAPTYGWLVAGRALQGAAAALITPAGTALLASSSSAHRLGRMIGTVGIAGPLAVAIGPLVGGAVTQALGWRWIFFLNVPLAAVAIFLVGGSARESRGHRVGGVDLAGLVSMTLGLTVLVLAVTKSPVWGLLTPLTMGLLSLAAASLGLFLVIESRVAQPLLHTRVLRHPRMIAATTAGFTCQFVVLAVTVYGLVYLQVVLGVGPLDAALLLMPLVVPQILLARHAGHLADRVGPAVPIVAGMVLMAVGAVLISLAGAARSYAAMAPAFVLLGVGVAVVDTAGNTAAQSAVHESYQGLAAGLNGSLRRLGSTLGVAAIGAVVIALQYDRGVQMLKGSGIRLGVGERATLQSLLVNGATGRRELNRLHHASQLEHAAHAAFVYAFANGMRLAAVVAALAALTASLFFVRSAHLPPLAGAQHKGASRA